MKTIEEIQTDIQSLMKATNNDQILHLCYILQDLLTLAKGPELPKDPSVDTGKDKTTL